MPDKWLQKKLAKFEITKNLSIEYKYRVRLILLSAWLTILASLILILRGLVFQDYFLLPVNGLRTLIGVSIIVLVLRQYFTLASILLLFFLYCTTLFTFLYNEHETIAPFTMMLLGLASGYLMRSRKLALISSAICLLSAALIRIYQTRAYPELISPSYTTAIVLILSIFWLFILLQRKEESLQQKQIQKHVRELDQQNESLRESNDMKIKMFSVVAHDLRAPMSLMLSMLEMMAEGLMEGRDGIDIVNDIKHQQQAVMRMLENLLQWAQTRLKDVPPKPEALDPADLIADELTIIGAQARKKQIQIQTVIEPESQIFADPNMTRFVIRNLLLNAIKFSETGSSIDLNVHPTEDQIQITIQDYGIGMSPQTAERIFSTQSSSVSGTSGEAGTGLGLLLSREFILKNQGTIDFESQLHKGSSFYIKLPKYNGMAAKQL